MSLFSQVWIPGFYQWMLVALSANCDTNHNLLHWLKYSEEIANAVGEQLLLGKEMLYTCL